MTITVTAAAAVYAASLSTYVLLREHWSRQARARVDAGYDSLPSSGGHLRGWAFAATISNTGREPICLAQAGVEILRGGTLTGAYLKGEKQFPRKLDPGESFTICLDLNTVYSYAAKGVNRLIRPLFFDQLGRRYSGAWMFASRSRKVGDTWNMESPGPPSMLEIFLARLVRRPRRLLGEAAEPASADQPPAGARKEVDT